MTIDVKILRSSCCDGIGSLEEELKAAAAEAGADIEIETLTELRNTMPYGARRYPALVIDGTLHDYEKLEGPRDLKRLFENRKEPSTR